MNAEAGSPALEARGIVKRFGSVVALDRVDFSLRAGEIHALVGENGAGKSTLMSLLYGLHAPDEGSIAMRGQTVRFADCAAAMRTGIGMVFQHFLLIERFTVAQNVLLGHEPVKMGMLDARAADAAVRDIARQYQFDLDPAAVVEHLGVGARQQVELVKVLQRDARIVILDEPTASLSPTEARSLFDVVRRLREQGRAIALVSHKLDEVLDVADRITVLRGGNVVGVIRAHEADVSALAELMVGRTIDSRPAPRTTVVGDLALVVENLAVRSEESNPLRDLNVVVRSAEILGVAGVEGNGQVEFAECLYGLRGASEGRVRLFDRDITNALTTARRSLGMRYVPPDRLREGLILEFTAAENMVLGDQRRTTSPLIDLDGARASADAVALDYALAGYSTGAAVASYSGGTQQKLIAGREFAPGASVVIAFSPTRGVDVGAAESIHRRLRQMRDEGAAIVLISYDLDEIRSLSDRIVVFSRGSIAGEVLPAEATDRVMGRLMGGVDRVA